MSWEHPPQGPRAAKTKREHIYRVGSDPATSISIGHADRTTASPSVDPPFLAPRVKCLCHRTRYPDNNVGLASPETQEWECAREWPWDRENRSAVRVHSRITRGVVCAGGTHPRRFRTAYQQAIEDHQSTCVIFSGFTLYGPQ